MAQESKHNKPTKSVQGKIPSYLTLIRPNLHVFFKFWESHFQRNINQNGAQPVLIGQILTHHKRENTQLKTEKGMNS